GLRLNIRKATLRHWRSQFAQQLRDLGVPANATERAVRGESRKSMKDGIYRARQRRESTHTRTRAQDVATEMVASRGLPPEPGKRTLLSTRAAVLRGWRAAAATLIQHGDRSLAADVVKFTDSFEQPLTDREWIARSLLALSRARQRDAMTL
ncbi:MAG: hypothetical protein KDH09_15950, partial [Chrysiogenetes bacterium]|nr:hypothetical protein [Chrysiogenetes bacterium]